MIPFLSFVFGDAFIYCIILSPRRQIVMSFFAAEENLAEIKAADVGSPLALHDVVKSLSTFKTTDDKKEIHYVVSMWRPKLETPRGFLFLCHGYGEYLSPAWEGVGRILAARGFLTFGHDHVGHGKSDGERVQVQDSFDEDYAAQVVLHCRERKKEHPELPLFILGHSLGGLIALLAVLQEPELFSGAIMQGPAIEVDPTMATPFNIFLAKWLGHFLPSMQVSGIKKDKITRDKEWVQRLKEDPLNWHGGLKLRQGYKGLLALENLAGRMPELTLPMLIQHGEEDAICRPQGSKMLFEKISSEDKELKMYEGAFHNLFIETEGVAEKCFKDEIDWLEKRL